jgi:hypothetical protein
MEQNSKNRRRVAKVGLTVDSGQPIGIDQIECRQGMAAQTQPAALYAPPRAAAMASPPILTCFDGIGKLWLGHSVPSLTLMSY